MAVAFPLLLLSAALLTFPAYLYSRRRGRESLWLLFVSLPAVLLWVFLTALDYGAQSLSNLIEVFLLLIAGIVLSYIKVFVLDRFMAASRPNTYLLLAFLIIGAFLLRTFMPLLPE